MRSVKFFVCFYAVMATILSGCGTTNTDADNGNPQSDDGNPVTDNGNPLADDGNPITDNGNSDIAEGDTGGDTGTLIMKMVVGHSADQTTSMALTKRAAISHPGLPIVDIRNILYELSVTPDTVTDGTPDSLTWYKIYEGYQELLNSELVLNKELPVGAYKAVKIVMSEYMYWVCEFGDGTVELLSHNGNASTDGKTRNVFSIDGLFMIDSSGNFAAADNNEKLGTEFEIRAGETSMVTFRTNMNTLDWNDNDGDGTWSDGDEISNWTTLPGTDTMTDFIVEYE